MEGSRQYAKSTGAVPGSTATLMQATEYGCRENFQLPWKEIPTYTSLACAFHVYADISSFHLHYSDHMQYRDNSQESEQGTAAKLIYIREIQTQI